MNKKTRNETSGFTKKQFIWKLLNDVFPSFVYVLIFLGVIMLVAINYFLYWKFSIGENARASLFWRACILLLAEIAVLVWGQCIYICFRFICVPFQKLRKVKNVAKLPLTEDEFLSLGLSSAREFGLFLIDLIGYKDTFGDTCIVELSARTRTALFSLQYEVFGEFFYFYKSDNTCLISKEAPYVDSSVYLYKKAISDSRYYHSLDDFLESKPGLWCQADNGKIVTGDYGDGSVVVSSEKNWSEYAKIGVPYLKECMRKGRRPCTAYFTTLGLLIYMKDTHEISVEDYMKYKECWASKTDNENQEVYERNERIR